MNDDEGKEIRKLVLKPTSGSKRGKEYSWKKLTVTELDSEEIGSIWVDFVNCPKRLKTSKPFLLHILENEHCIKILDAASRNRL